MTIPCRSRQVSDLAKHVKTNRSLTSDPRAVVGALLEELAHTLGLITDSARRGEDLLVSQYQENASKILGGLDRELEFDLAGDLSETLRILYNEAAKRIRMEDMEACIERIESAREMIREIEKAWAGIVAFN
ncbi:flagellar export chaperone FliS [Sphingorhabdus sp. SMR4y]|uniref:flagellar export chaperone FliS n=1 Tax=Sphingorhabdus sp. SMR4y TaxID=2584094 RepID=UPI000B5CB5BA|nr:flagellar protein FliS [Sphingorhabdus sp. SMR4y]ASK87024.1 flagellar protein FliS [Sphingorhabdus sp. SMR4y]